MSVAHQDLQPKSFFDWNIVYFFKLHHISNFEPIKRKDIKKKKMDNLFEIVWNSKMFNHDGFSSNGFAA